MSPDEQKNLAECQKVLPKLVDEQYKEEVTIYGETIFRSMGLHRLLNRSIKTALQALSAIRITVAIHDDALDGLKILYDLQQKYEISHVDCAVLESVLKSILKKSS